MELRRPRRRVPSAEGDDGSYYAALSRKFAVVKWSVIVLIPVFVVIMLAIFHSSITYDNLTYLLRDFQSEPGSITSEFADVSFESQNALDAALFRGELAVCGSSNVTLYNSSGSKTFEYRSGMSDPALITTDKYMLAYDVGGTKYSIYTNLARVFDGEEDSVIENVSMAQNGSYLITKRSRDAKYVVALYDADFRNRANYKRPRFVSDAVITPDAKHIVIVSVSNSGAALQTNVEMYDFAGTEPTTSYNGTGFLPIRAACFSDGSFALICDTRIIFFDEKGSVITTFYPENGRVSCVDAGKDSLCVAYSGSVTGFAADVMVFDKAGNIIYNIETEQKISDVSHSDRYVFAIGANHAYRFSREDGSVRRAELEGDAERIVCAGEFAVVVSANGATGVFREAPAPESAKE